MVKKPKVDTSGTKQYFQQAPAAITFEASDGSLVISGSNTSEIVGLLNVAIQSPEIAKFLGMEKTEEKSFSAAVV